MSNAASYQSVPQLRHTNPDTGKVDWSKNPLPPDWRPRDVAQAVARASKLGLVDVPVLNGFCLLVKAEVFGVVGLFDDVASPLPRLRASPPKSAPFFRFPHGFGEENDFALRAARLGYRLKVADGVYVWHHKSKSYGDATRKDLSSESRATLLQRWGPQLRDAVQALEREPALDEARRRVAANLGARNATEGCRPAALRVLFVLNPIRRAPQPPAMHGGWISIVNQAIGLRKRGVCARVAISAWTLGTFRSNFRDGDDVFLPYKDNVRTPRDLADALRDHAAAFDFLVATLFTTVEAIADVAACHPNVQTGYFIQDYEADFDNLDLVLKEKALESYTRVEGMVLFAKTRWLRERVARNHNVTVHAVTGSVDLGAFDAARAAHDERVRSEADQRSGVARVVAMLRPSTPRRNPTGTLDVLRRVRARFGDRVDVHTFGCPDDELDAFLSASDRSFLTHHGTLRREDVAALFGASDVFLDMSHWQAWGRTGLEAMAAGCVPVLPGGSGSEEYAVHDANAKLTNTTEPAEAVDAVGHLVADAKFRDRLRTKAIWTAGDFDLATASLTVLKLFCDRLDDAVDRLLLAPSPCVVDGRLDLAMNSTEREARAARTRLAFENARLARARERADKAARSRDGVLAKLEKRPPKRRRGRGGPLKGF